MLIYFDILSIPKYISYFDISLLFHICTLKFWEICTQDRQNQSRIGGLGADFWVEIFTFWFQFGKSPKYQNIIAEISKYGSIQNIKISAVSTPIFASKAAFFSIFQDLPGNPAENASTFQKPPKSFSPKFEIFLKTRKFLIYFDILTTFDYISYFDISPLFYICILKFWEICTQSAQALRFRPPTKLRTRKKCSIVGMHLAELLGVTVIKIVKSWSEQRKVGGLPSSN